MIIQVTDHWAHMVKDDTLRQNSKKAYEVVFCFDESWDGFSKTAIFEAGPASVIVALTEDRCLIPSECLRHGSVKLKIGIYGINGEKRKATLWCLTSMIIPDFGLGTGASFPPQPPDELYSEIMAAIGDLSAAGFEGKTLAEVFREIRDNSCCETATDEEVQSVLSSTFGVKTDFPEMPGTSESDNTATDGEVIDILNDVFGR